MTDDGMAACPICSERMKAEDVYLHLDTHQEDYKPKGVNKPKSLLSRLVYRGYSDTKL